LTKICGIIIIQLIKFKVERYPIQKPWKSLRIKPTHSPKHSNDHLPNGTDACGTMITWNYGRIYFVAEMR